MKERDSKTSFKHLINHTGESTAHPSNGVGLLVVWLRAAPRPWFLRFKNVDQSFKTTPNMLAVPVRTRKRSVDSAVDRIDPPLLVWIRNDHLSTRPQPAV